MRWVKGFGRFWWDFVIGDTPGLTLGVVIAIGLGAIFAHTAHLGVVLVPLTVLAFLAVSLGRARKSSA